MAARFIKNNVLPFPAATCPETMERDLARSGLVPKDLRAEKLQPDETKRLTGHRGPAFAIPYFDINRQPTGFVRVRYLNPPRTFKKPDKPQRYWQPPNSGCPFYLAPIFDWKKAARDSKVSLLITEGEKKAAKACKHGFATLGLGGVSNWTLEGLENFARDFNLNGRTVYLVYDSDAATNEKVQGAEARLTNALAKFGARVCVLRLPAGKGGAKVGLDDFLVTYGENGLRAFLDASTVTDSALWQKRYSLAELLRDAVYLEANDTITLLSRPYLDCGPEHFKRLLAASTEKIKTDKGEKVVSVAELWLKHDARKTAHARTFAPGQGEVCPDPDGRQAVNAWRPVTFNVLKDWVRRVKPFVEHLRYLVPDPRAHEQVEAWLAHLVQRPGEAAPWHVLMYTDGVQGVGRNWLASVIARVVCPYSALNVDISVLAGNVQGATYNGAIARKLFTCVDELHASTFAAGGRRMMENLKSTLTAEHRKINPKYGKESTEFNRLRVLILSNHVSAMPLDDEDRRFLVARNPDQVKEPAYYERLYQLLANDDGFIASVWQYLQKRNFSKLAMGRPPVTAAKAELIETVEPDFVRKLRNRIGDDQELATTKWLRTGITEEWQVRAAMRALRAIKYPKKVAIKGEKHNVWILKDPKRWLYAPHGEVAERLRVEEEARERRRNER